MDGTGFGEDVTSTSRRRRTSRSNPSIDPAIAQVIIEASARAAYVDSYAARCEELGLDGTGPGEDWMDVAPATSSAARQWAEALWTDIVERSSTLRDAPFAEQLVELWGEAVSRWRSETIRRAKAKAEYAAVPYRQEMVEDSADVENSESDARDFGHYIAMQSMGHGVSWEDDHADPGLVVPHHEADPWALVPDADLAAVVTEDVVDNAFDVEEVVPKDASNETALAFDEAAELWFEYGSAARQNRTTDALTILGRLRDSLNYNAAYTNENFQRLHALVDIFYAGQLVEYETEGSSRPPRTNPASEVESARAAARRGTAERAQMTRQNPGALKSISQIQSLGSGFLPGQVVFVVMSDRSKNASVLYFGIDKYDVERMTRDFKNGTGRAVGRFSTACTRVARVVDEKTIELIEAGRTGSAR